MEPIAQTPEGATQSRSRTRINRWNALLLPGIVLLLVVAWPLAARLNSAMQYPFQLDAEEGYILQQAVMLARGDAIYRPLHDPPWLVGNYTPLLPALYGMLNGSRVGLNSLPLGRLLIAISVCLCAVMLGILGWRVSRQPGPALLAPLIWLASYEVHHWAAFVRVDIPALALTLAGLATFLAAGRATRRRPWLDAAAGLLMMAAIYTRQTAILAPLACGLALLQSDRRRLVWLAGPALTAGLLLLAWLQWRTAGEFARHTIEYNRNQLDWLGWRLVMKNEVWFFYRWLILTALAVCLAAWIGRANRWRRRRIAGSAPATPPDQERQCATACLNWYLALGTISLLGYAKVGAAPNYVLEPLAALAIWLAAAWGRWNALAPPAAHHPRRTSPASLAMPLLLALGLLAHGLWLLRLSPAIHSSPSPIPADIAAARELIPLLRASQGDVLSEDPIFAQIAGKPVLFQPFIMTQLAREGKWNAEPLIGMIERQRFGTIIVTEDLAGGDPATEYQRYTAAMAATIRRSYRPRGTVSLAGLRKTYFVWTPHLATAGGH